MYWYGTMQIKTKPTFFGAFPHTYENRSERYIITRAAVVVFVTDYRSVR